MAGTATKAGVVQPIPGRISADRKGRTGSHLIGKHPLYLDKVEAGCRSCELPLWACVPTCSHLLPWQEKHSYICVRGDNSPLLSEGDREKGCLGAPGHGVQAASLSGE